MKKLIIVLVLLTGAFNFSIGAEAPKELSCHAIKPERKIDITLTSTSGCKFHIVGDVSVGLGGISFTGTITLSGSGCSGTYTFALVVNPDDNCDVSLVSGSTDVWDMINSDDHLKCEMGQAFIDNAG